MTQLIGLLCLAWMSAPTTAIEPPAVVAPATAVEAHPEWQTFRHTSGVAFRYPQGWKVQQTDTPLPTGQTVRAYWDEEGKFTWGIKDKEAEEDEPLEPQ